MPLEELSTVSQPSAPAAPEPKPKTDAVKSQPEPRGMEVVVVQGYESLLQYVPAWEALAASVIEPNPFYEHWMLLPAIRAFGQGKKFRFVLIFWRDPARNSAPPLLCGLFPLERQPRYMGLPVSTWSMWKHAHCFLTLPLIRKEHAAECLSALFDWLSGGPEACSLLEWRNMPGDGPIHQLLVDEFSRTSTVPFIWEWYTRAFLRPLESADRYLSTALSGKHRKALRRRAELLSELGRVEYAMLEPGGNVAASIDDFLRIEASGWKGQEGSALACQESHRAFFLSVAEEAFRRNRLFMPAMLLDGKPIAQNCYFMAGRGCFHFKTSFDEQYSRFSPGFDLECETIRRLHGMSGIDWLDSCTSAGNTMFNRLYLSRRTIQSLLIPLSKGIGRFVVAAIPFLRLLKRSAGSLAKPALRGEETAQEVDLSARNT